MTQSTTTKIPLEIVESSLSDTSHESVGVAEESVPSNKSRIEEQHLIVFPFIAKAVFIFLLLVFVVIGATYFWAVNSETLPDWVAPLMTGLWAVSGLGVLGLLYWVWRQFSAFSNDLSIWVQQLLQGKYPARMNVGSQNLSSSGIRLYINAISDEYQALSEFQQQRYVRQAERIEQKKFHLGVLYDVSSSINESNDLEDLLQRFLDTLTTVVNAKAATVRLLDKDGQMRLVASIGLNDEIIALEDKIPAPDCLCGQAFKNTSVLVNNDVKQCSLIVGSNFFENDEDIEMLAIPLQYRGKTLGVYNIFLHRKEHDILEGEHELLVSIGQHLGMAIEQAGIEDDARTLSIIEERTRMAHELHDSLAQTLASLRFKVRLFDDSLNQGDDEVIWHELEGLENTIDDAYAELRSLITHFRAPIDGKGVVRSVERVSEKFKIETDLDVFFYHNWDFQGLPRDTEIEVVRIVQEALANIRKHANANSVRILLTSTKEGQCSVLVEDDGIGLNTDRARPNSKTGDHIGLSIMRERAERIKGEIQFESDAEEGTLVQLNFDAHLEKNPVILNPIKH